MHTFCRRLAIATGRKRNARSMPTSGDDDSSDEDTDGFTEEQKGQLEMAEEAGLRPPPLVDGKTDRWVEMDYASMTPIQRQVYLDKSIVVLAAWVVDVVDAAGGGQEGVARWQEVALRMGRHLQAIDKATGVPDSTIEKRQQELVQVLSGLGSGEDFNSRAQLAKSAISTLATDLLTVKFQKENAANPPPAWKKVKRGKKKRLSASSSGSKRDFGGLLDDLQPQLEEGRKQQEDFQQQTLAWQRKQEERADETLVVLRALKEGSEKQTEVLAALAAILSKQSRGG